MSFTVHHPCNHADAKVGAVALVVTGHRVCVHIRQAGQWVVGVQAHQDAFLGGRGCTMRPWAGSWRWITLVLLAWGTLLFYIGGHLVRDSEHPERSSRELSKILAKLERLKQQNEDLRRMAESLRIPEGQADTGSLAAVGRLRSLEDQLTRAKQKIHSFQKLTGDGPGVDGVNQSTALVSFRLQLESQSSPALNLLQLSTDDGRDMCKPEQSTVSSLWVTPHCLSGPGPTQEELRRTVENGVKEFWYFVRSEVKKLSNSELSERQKYADTLLQDLGHQERSIMTDLYYLSQADGVGEWRVKEAKDLSDLVQNRITYLQWRQTGKGNKENNISHVLLHVTEQGFERYKMKVKQ
ncbi:hypothetical protein F7725_019772 [Dissostichus mawsoni]|uniref:Alpha-(1,6)-fucosyltransferase N- and catalytic domain-containing protein n=1 Tax=Dissostichus mawsoni TaxID=36200 RepID=A0A7J5YLL9_DISMA|nr:hypothetical protein F7725_019772 [Dissostichus mawsoni]